MTGLTWALYQILCVFTSGSTNCQETIGQDLTEGEAVSAIATSEMLTANGYTSSTKSSAATSLMYLFVSQPWGNVLQWISGFKSVSAVWGIINDQKQARGVSISDAIPSTWSTLTFPTGTNYKYQVEAQGVNAAPLFVKEGGGSTTTYYCDYLFWYTSTYSTYRGACVGGHFNSGDGAGVFSIFAGYAVNATGNNKGSRLQCLDVEDA